MFREGIFAPGEYYHLLARGNYKQTIFLDERDYIRFLFSTLHFQSPKKFINIGRHVSYYVKHRMFNISEDVVRKVVEDRYVELIGFCLMPNHFHLIVKEVEEKGISNYMQRTLNSFSKYHNTKYDKKGHLFEGPYKAVHVKSDEQLLYLSAYIHRNPREIQGWKKKEIDYPWSSYQDFARKNRWGDLLVPDVISGRFKNPEDYIESVEESGAKEEFEGVLDNAFPDKWFE